MSESVSWEDDFVGALMCPMACCVALQQERAERTWQREMIRVTQLLEVLLCSLSVCCGHTVWMMLQTQLLVRVLHLYINMSDSCCMRFTSVVAWAYFEMQTI